MTTQYSEFNQDQTSYEYHDSQESKAPNSQKEKSFSEQPEELPLMDYLKAKGKKLKQKSKVHAEKIKAKSIEISQRVKCEAKRTGLEMRRLALETKHKMHEKHAEWKSREQERRHRHHMNASPDSPSDTTGVPYFCPFCGNQVTPGGKFCPNCGNNY